MSRSPLYRISTGRHDRSGNRSRRCRRRCYDAARQATRKARRQPVANWQQGTAGPLRRERLLHRRYVETSSPLDLNRGGTWWPSRDPGRNANGQARKSNRFRRPFVDKTTPPRRPERKTNRGESGHLGAGALPAQVGLHEAVEVSVEHPHHVADLVVGAQVLHELVRL